VVKGFLERNIKRMLAFFRPYQCPFAIAPQPVAQLPDAEKAPRAVVQTLEANDFTRWLAGAAPAVSLEAVRRALAKAPVTIAQLIHAEREER
jgi:hypothetical protein